MNERRTLHDQFMDHDSWIGPRITRAKRPNLDAHYVGRVMNMITDQAQICVTGNHIDVKRFRESIPELAKRIVAETFREVIEL